MEKLVSKWLECCLTALALLGAAVPASVAARETPGTPADPITRASSLEPGHGVAILSVRSELFLVATLNVYFLREGGDPVNKADVIRFSRSQPALAFGNTTTKYKIRAAQLPAGKYRLIAHGAKCEKIPAPDERCLADVKFIGIGETVSFPSRGYEEGAPVFEVREGAVTVVGDFGLTARNTLEWSAIPADKLNRVMRKFASLPRSQEPEISKEFELKYPLRPRSYDDDKNRRY